MRMRFLMLMLFLLGTAITIPVYSYNPRHQCAYCHTVHNAPGMSLTTEPNREVLCLTCHGPAGTSTLKADVHSNKASTPYPPFRITCLQCHHHHDGQPPWVLPNRTSLKNVGRLYGTNAFARISTPNSNVRYVVFLSRGTGVGQPSLYSFADGDQDGNGYYDGTCETCHTLTKFHRNNASGSHNHNTGKTCTLSCHLHSNKFNK